MKTQHKTTKVILTFLIIILINNGSLYSQTTVFEVIKESMDAAQAYSVAESQDHGFVVSCITDLGEDQLIFKLDSLGNEIWSKTISSYGARSGYHIINTVDSAFVIAGIVNYEIFLLKIDCTGEVLWEKIFEDSNNMFINSVIQNSDKEYLLVGRAENNSNSYRPLLIKTNEEGEILWEKTYDIDNYAAGFSVAETFDSGYIIGGSTASSALLIKTDSAGNLTWSQTYEIMFSTGSITPAFQTHDSCYVFITNSIAFDIDGNENTQCDFFKTDNSGNVIYRKGYYKKMYSILSACQTSDEGYLLTGTGNSAIYMFETDSLFNQVAYCDFASGKGNCIRQTSDGGAIIAGISDDNIYVVKTNNSIDFVSSDQKGDLRVFPNPVNNSATISFNLSREQYYDAKTLNIYDLEGRKVRTIENINTNSIFIDVTGFMKGIYTLQLVTQDGSVLTGKMMVK